ncbi:hypothetical protein [Pyrococcus kukulkanii]|uniref:Uncharacterized protein n=1 Tax=Pyrococcus kukulkanii TaxID=1609559 RepID=A0ABV4T5Z3_9EURY
MVIPITRYGNSSYFSIDPIVSLQTFRKAVKIDQGPVFYRNAIIFRVQKSRATLTFIKFEKFASRVIYKKVIEYSSVKEAAKAFSKYFNVDYKKAEGVIGHLMQY